MQHPVVGRTGGAHVDRLIDLSDEELARLGRDDHAAFETLYYRYVTQVYRYCYVRTNSVADAEDLTSQTFMGALESLAGYHGRGSFPAWLFGIARRKCADYHRRAYKPGSDRDMASLETGDDEALQVADPEAEDPETRAVHNAFMDCVERMLPQLSPDRREALHLRYWGDRSIHEVAVVMRKTEAAIKMLVSRAIADLKERCVQ